MGHRRQIDKTAQYFGFAGGNGGTLMGITIGPIGVFWRVSGGPGVLYLCGVSFQFQHQPKIAIWTGQFKAILRGNYPVLSHSTDHSTIWAFHFHKHSSK
jgi:hypothetical protein